MIRPAQDHFIFLTVYIISMTFVFSLTRMLVLLYVYVMHASLHFGLCGRKFVLCLLIGRCLGLCTLCHSWQHAGVVHLTLQADGNYLNRVAFQDIPVFAWGMPPSLPYDSSLYLFVLVLFFEAVGLHLGHFLSAHCSRLYGCCLTITYLCLCDVHLKTHSPTFIG